ncbi:hypothetical protein HIM_06299 [Hirsutella minnesotensis 3608]|uniref:Uncharacterized protein n=1 Tax=Hirsutella minnesotensis 3608 TaxID=1043627 RepID=A0A0F7ZU59_9HYPO|nr:hypothetical protein HIM_06299 [Hirsutella minnesotensis 3608]
MSPDSPRRETLPLVALTDWLHPASWAAQVEEARLNPIFHALQPQRSSHARSLQLDRLHLGGQMEKIRLRCPSCADRRLSPPLEPPGDQITGYHGIWPSSRYLKSIQNGYKPACIHRLRLVLILTKDAPGARPEAINKLRSSGAAKAAPDSSCTASP